MGAIRTLKDNGSSYTIPSSVDGAVYSLISEDCVIDGMGYNFGLDYRSSSLNVAFGKGCQALIGGNAFWLEDAVDVTLPADSTIYLCARIDPTKPSGQTGSIECLTESGMLSGNPNSGGIRDMLLYIVTTNSSGISNVVDKRNIVNSTNTYVTRTYLDNFYYTKFGHMLAGSETNIEDDYIYISFENGDNPDSPRFVFDNKTGLIWFPNKSNQDNWKAIATEEFVKNYVYSQNTSLEEIKAIANEAKEEAYYVDSKLGTQVTYTLDGTNLYINTK